MELWGVDIWWYAPAALAPFVGAWLAGVFGGGCSACVAGYCKEHGA